MRDNQLFLSLELDLPTSVGLFLRQYQQAYLCAIKRTKLYTGMQACLDADISSALNLPAGSMSDLNGSISGAIQHKLGLHTLGAKEDIGDLFRLNDASQQLCSGRFKQEACMQT